MLAFEPGKAEFRSFNDELLKTSQDVNFSNGCEDQIDWGTIEFSFDLEQPDEKKPAMIVDGQHRLLGMSDYIEEDLPILVVSLLDSGLDEQAFQFIVVNNKAVKVPTDNVKSIIAQIDQEKLQGRLLKVGVRYGEKSPNLYEIDNLDTSPFKGLLSWPTSREREGKGLVSLTAAEQALRYINVFFEKSLKDDEDSQLELFLAIWRVVKENYPDLWGKDNQFMKKVNINALNEFLVERLKFASEMDIVDIFDIEKVEKFISTRVQLLPKGFWEADWTIKIQDNANVRKLIKKDLDTLLENCKLKRNWKEDLKVIQTTE